jgi:hypothetical protein
MHHKQKGPLQAALWVTQSEFYDQLPVFVVVGGTGVIGAGAAASDVMTGEVCTVC